MLCSLLHLNLSGRLEARFFRLSDIDYCYSMGVMSKVAPKNKALKHSERFGLPRYSVGNDNRFERILVVVSIVASLVYVSGYLKQLFEGILVVFGQK